MTTLRQAKLHDANFGGHPVTTTNGYYRPERRSDDDYGPSLYARFVQNLPAASAFVSKFDENGHDAEISFGEITGILRRWDEITTKKGDKTHVAEIEIQMPEIAWNRKVVTVFAWSAMLWDCLDYVHQKNGSRPFTLRRVSDDGRAHIYEVKLDAQPASGQAAKSGKPTTAAGWTNLYRQRFDAGSNQDILSQIITQAATDGYSFNERDLLFSDDLPF